MTIESLYKLLLDVWRESDRINFSGIGIIVSNTPGDLPIINLRDTPTVKKSSTLELLSSISSKKSEYHDGFHVLDELGGVTYISQYFSPQIIKGISFDRSRLVGGRFVAALYGSCIAEIKFTGIVSEGNRLSIFEAGKEIYNEGLK